MGSTCSVPATLGLPPFAACVLFWSTLLRLQVALQGVGQSWVHFPHLSCSVSDSRVLHKGADSVGPAILCLPISSSSGNQELDERTLFRCSATSPLPGPSLSFRACLIRCALCLFCGADLWLRPSRRMSTIQNLRKSLVRNWQPVSTLVGDAVSGAKSAPFWLCLLPACLPASWWGMGWSAAC